MFWISQLLNFIYDYRYIAERKTSFITPALTGKQLLSEAQQLNVRVKRDVS
jgi:hypothetical protein